MRAIKIVFLTVTGICAATRCFTAPVPGKSVAVRVAAYNVEFGRSTTPEQVGEMFKPYALDIIGFNEVPDGEWTARVGKVLGMKYSYVGKISSANHKDKYKSILSRAPLKETKEVELRVKRGWNPASVIRGVTEIDGVSIAFYSLHICGFKETKIKKKLNIKDSHIYQLTTEVLPKETSGRVIVVGDYNNNIGDAAMDAIEGVGFRPTWQDLKIDVSSAFTYNALNPQKNHGVIDHILYNTASGARATGGAISELAKPLSDHKPIWAEIVFPRKLKTLKGSGNRLKSN